MTKSQELEPANEPMKEPEPFEKKIWGAWTGATRGKNEEPEPIEKKTEPQIMRLPNPKFKDESITG